ncbi:tetratricopeptide repeat protein [Floridanema aerugineum]|uniref:Tetratricopeptide repeat protein n=1 Tax=Floridaenema aerugineum BLCC-F46 TaxID=3153654 RepID=A0ABV4X4S9_9CYAN
MIKTLEAVIRRQWLPPEFAVREVVAFERRFGMKHLSLACHAALPLFLTPELVNLIHINFLDGENLPWIAESDFLLSSLCRPRYEGVFELEPCVREVLLVELENRFGWRRPFEVANFLRIYLQNQPDWKHSPEQIRTQKWIAQAYLNPDQVVEELTDFLEESLPEENPVLRSPSKLEIPQIVEILAEPLERTSIDLWSERQYLVNSSRALAQILYGEKEDLKATITAQARQSETGEGELMMLSPVIHHLLRNLEVTPVKMGCAVVLTDIPVEYIAVCSHLVDLKEETHPQGTVYERGKFIANGKTWEVGIVEIGAGNAGAALEAERAIAYFNPSVILFVGVAGGIKDVILGDVVAATKVYNYESGKAEQKFQLRPDIGLSTYNLIQRARAEAKKTDWLQRFKLGTNNAPRVFVAPIAAGEKVFASSKSSVFKFLRSNYGDVIAVEIEGRGLLQVAHANQQVSTLIVRGISELIDGKSEAYKAGSQEIAAQEIAARNASAFAFEVLAKLDINEVNNTTPNSQYSTQPASPNFLAYDDVWVGRESVIQELSRRVQESCRLLILVGMIGIGKTALGERLAVELSHWFDDDWTKFHQENFDNEEQTSDFASVAARWLEKWGELITPEDRKDTQRLLHRLVRHLQENRYLVQIDSLENILQGNEEEGWSDFQDEWWVRFFQSLLAADICQSCIILTSQDLPAQIPTMGTKYQNFWYCQPLSGLEKPEQLVLFEKTGLEISINSPGRAYLERIGSAYEGYPLALRVIAGEIRNQPFNGNVVAYWNQYGREVEEVEKAIEEAKTKGITASADDKFNLHRYTRQLRRNVRVRLEKTFERLKKNVRYAYILLCEASVYRSPVPEDFWLSHLEDWERNEEEPQVLLDALRDRFLVEEVIENNQCLLRQHNLIRSVALEHLRKLDEDGETNLTPDGELVLAKLGTDVNDIKRIIPRYQRMHYRAVVNWLTNYHPKPDASNLEKIRGYLEAFYHLCNLENWEAASKILLTRLNTPTKEELYKQLGIWGYYREQVQVCSGLIGKLNSSFDINLLNTLGNSYYIFGDYRRAIEYLEQSLTNAREIQALLGEENALVNLGKVYQSLGDYLRAIDFHGQSLVIAQEIGDRIGEEQALTNLGGVYVNIADYEKAIEYLQRSLIIAREIGDRQGEAQALGNLGLAYQFLGNYETAINYYQHQLGIARKIEDVFSQGWVLCNLGNTLIQCADYSTALEYLQTSLNIFRQIGSRANEAEALKNLAEVHQHLGHLDTAIEFSDQALAIATELGIPLANECQQLRDRLTNIRINS